MPDRRAGGPQKMHIFHLADREIWGITRSTGVPYTMSTRDLTLEQEGFIHCCADLDQVRGVIGRYYAGVEDTLVLLVIDTDLVDAAVRYEPSGGETFPHIYGPITREAVIDVRPVPTTQ
jgi:uncharacterized protein (DUF952 family)